MEKNQLKIWNFESFVHKHQRGGGYFSRVLAQKHTRGEVVFSKMSDKFTKEYPCLKIPQESCGSPN